MFNLSHDKINLTTVMNHFLTIKLRKMRNIQKIIPLGIHVQFIEVQNGIPPMENLVVFNSIINILILKYDNILEIYTIIYLISMIFHVPCYSSCYYLTLEFGKRRLVE